MTMTRARLALVTAIALVAVGLPNVTGAIGGYDDTGAGMMGGSGMMGDWSGSGMMGDGNAMMGDGSGMMGGPALPGDGVGVGSLAAARQRAQILADRLGQRVGDVLRFDNGYYAVLRAADGTAASEVLVDPATGAVRVEPGPASRWRTDSAAAPVSVAEAVRLADRWLAGRPSGVPEGLKAGAPERFPGHVTLRASRDGELAGLLSVSAFTGAVWYHSWHGRYLETSEG